MLKWDQSQAKRILGLLVKIFTEASLSSVDPARMNRSSMIVEVDEWREVCRMKCCL